MTATSPWPTRAIGELFEIGAGKTLNAAARTEEPQYPFLRTANVFWGRVELAELDQMHFTPRELSQKTLRKGDLLVCEGGDIGRAAIWDGQVPVCGFQNHLHRLRPRHGGVIPAFVVYALQAGFTLHGRYEGTGNRTTIPNLSRGRLEALEVPAPPPAEQSRIASILSLVQRNVRIESHILAVLRELRVAAIRHLFSPTGESNRDTELDPLPPDWDVARLGDVCTFLSGGTPSKASPDYWAGTIPWASPKDLKTPRLSDTEDHISEEGLADGSKLAPTGSVLVVVRGMILARDVPVALITVPMALNQDLKAVVPGDRLDPEYLLYAITAVRSRLFQRIGRSAHGTRTLLSHELAALPIPVPRTMPEQRRVASLLSMIDRAISTHERQRTALTELFTSMLDKLISGEVRIGDLAVEVAEVQTT